MTFPDRQAAELTDARAIHPPLHGPHEAYAVILEELEEFWLTVRTADNPPHDPLTELIQIAAMAQRAAEDLHLI